VAIVSVGVAFECSAQQPYSSPAKGLPEPANFMSHTAVCDPKDPFRFSFQNLNGKLVSNTDKHFRSKAVIAVIAGTIDASSRSVQLAVDSEQ
jgi:hypothetical protein